MLSILFVMVLIPTSIVGFIYELYVLSESEEMQKVHSLFKYAALLFLFVVQEYFIAYITYNTVGFICFQYTISIATFMISRKFALMTGLFTPIVINLFLYNIGEFTPLFCILSCIAVLLVFLAMNAFLNKSFTVQLYRYSGTLILISLLTMNPATGSFDIHFYTVAKFLKVFLGCLLIIWFSYIFFREIEQKKNRISELEYMKAHDKLTGLYNYREFRNNLNTIDESSDKNYLAAMLDLDNFKKFNDEFGHDEGNRFLESFAKKLLNYMRKNNDTNVTVYRFGGEEFCILIKNTPVEMAHIKLNDFIIFLQADKYKTNSGKEMRVSCSAGISDARKFDSIYAAVRAADDALYQAKREGKGRVVTNNIGDSLSLRSMVSDSAQ